MATESRAGATPNLPRDRHTGGFENPPLQQATSHLGDHGPGRRHRVVRGGDGPAHDDEVNARANRVSRGHDPLLVAGLLTRGPDAPASPA